MLDMTATTRLANVGITMNVVFLYLKDFNPQVPGSAKLGGLVDRQSGWVPV